MKRLLKLLVALIVTYLATRSFIGQGFPLLHDSTHLSRTYLFDQTIRSGQFPPIWADEANYTLGYPLFHLYAPLAYFVAWFFSLSVPFLAAVKLSFILAVITGFYGMYRLLQSKGRAAALLASVAYVLAPYLAVNLHVRGALAEVWSMAMLPWVFWVWKKPNAKHSSILKISAVSTLFVISHNLIPIITLPFLCIWILLNNRKNLKYVIISALYSILLASFFLGPLIFERSFTHVEQVAKTTNYSHHYVAPRQLWNSTWGYGGSAPGIEDGMSFKVGKLHLLLSGFALVLSIKRRRSLRLSIFFSTMLIVSAYLSTSHSSQIWDNIPLLQIVQFPWRYLSLVTFAASVLVGLSVSLLYKLIRPAAVALFILCIILLNNKYFVSLPLQVDYATQYLSDHYNQEIVASVIPEYLPTWSDKLANIPPNSLYEVQNSETQVISSSYNHYEFNISSTTSSSLVLNKLYYPTWSAKLDGDHAPITPNSQGLVSINIPAGSHYLTVRQSHTTLERISYIITLITFIYLVTKTRHEK